MMTALAFSVMENGLRDVLDPRFAIAVAAEGSLRGVIMEPAGAFQ